MECSSLKDATKDVTNSGRDVPKATTDNPITISVIPIIPANKIAPFINSSDPKYIKETPRINRKIVQ